MMEKQHHHHQQQQEQRSSSDLLARSQDGLGTDVDVATPAPKDARSRELESKETNLKKKRTGRYRRMGRMSKLDVVNAPDLDREAEDQPAVFVRKYTSLRPSLLR
jgi:hypothetical protein